MMPWKTTFERSVANVAAIKNESWLTKKSFPKLVLFLSELKYLSTQNFCYDV